MRVCVLWEQSPACRSTPTKYHHDGLLQCVCDAHCLLMCDAVPRMQCARGTVGRSPQPSRRRDCHSAASPSPFSRSFNMDGEGMSVQ